MKISKVKVFDKKLSNLQSRDLCKELDGKIVKDGKIKSKGKVYDIMDYEVVDGCYCEFDDDEEFGLSMFKSSTKQAKDMYESALRKQKRYERLLLDKIDKDAVFGDEREECECSPFSKCCWKIYDDGDSVNGVERCVFCGREKERWILR